MTEPAKRTRSKQPTRYTIEVTEDDIERAHRNNSYRCVVAQAVARSVPNATNIDVDTQAVRFTRAGERLIYLTPYAVQGYVIAFDAGEPIEPFSFQLRNPRRTRRRELTEAGKAINNARARDRRATTVSRKKGEPVPREASEAGSVLAAYGAAKRETSDGGTGKPPPRVFKTRRRSYGHRLLRINQDV